MIITLGFTESDRDHDYISFSDGYRPARRACIVTTLRPARPRRATRAVHTRHAVTRRAVAASVTAVTP